MTAGKGYDPARGAQMIAWAKGFLDTAVPLASGSWPDFAWGRTTSRRSAQFIGRAGDNLLFKHNGLHIEVVIDRARPNGKGDPAGIAEDNKVSDKRAQVRRLSYAATLEVAAP